MLSERSLATSLICEITGSQRRSADRAGSACYAVKVAAQDRLAVQDRQYKIGTLPAHCLM